MTRRGRDGGNAERTEAGDGLQGLANFRANGGARAPLPPGVLAKREGPHTPPKWNAGPKKEEMASMSGAGPRSLRRKSGRSQDARATGVAQDADTS